MNRQMLELLATLHGVQFEESTSDEDLQRKLSEKLASSGSQGDPNPPAPPAPPAPPTPPAPENPHMTPAILSELEKAGSENALVAALVNAYKDTQQQVAALSAANRLSEVRRKLADIGDARRVLTPNVSQKLSELVAAMPPKAGDAVLGVVKEILGDGGTIELGERGRTTPEGKDAAAKFESAVQKLMEDNDKLDYADAVTQVAAANGDLFDAYRQSATMDWR